MRRLQWLLLLGLAGGCERPRRGDSLSNEDVARILQENPGAKWDREVAKCLPPPIILDMRVNDAYTVRERLNAMGAKALDDRTLIGRDGKVIYRRPESPEEVDNKGVEKFLIALGAIPTAKPPAAP